MDQESDLVCKFSLPERSLQPQGHVTCYKYGLFLILLIKLNCSHYIQPLLPAVLLNSAPRPHTMHLSWCSGNICSSAYLLSLHAVPTQACKNSLQTFKHVDENEVSFCFLFSFCWLSIIPGGLGGWDSAAFLGTLWSRTWSKAEIGWRLYVNISR